MSTTEIIQELPNLSLKERREIAKRILELEEDQESINFSLNATDQAFKALDELEKKDS